MFYSFWFHCFLLGCFVLSKNLLADSFPSLVLSLSFEKLFQPTRRTHWRTESKLLERFCHWEVKPYHWAWAKSHRPSQPQPSWHGQQLMFLISLFPCKGGRRVGDARQIRPWEKNTYKLRAKVSLPVCLADAPSSIVGSKHSSWNKMQNTGWRDVGQRWLFCSNPGKTI